jgi:hypothetical protein
MKQSRSAVRDLSKAGPEPEADPFMDEAMAMVYVGDVYSLVAQEGATTEAKSKPAVSKNQTRDELQDDNDALLPFIR